MRGMSLEVSHNVSLKWADSLIAFSRLRTANVQGEEGETTQNDHFSLCFSLGS